MLDFGLEDSALGHLTSLVQFGFIAGTLLFAILLLADRYLPSRVFFICALFGALSNLALVVEGNSFFTLAVLRFATGFFLAGIYPVGMKIASDYYNKGLGKSLGLLVSALVLGTAFPHFLKITIGSVSWHMVIITTSLIATFGGVLLLIFVPKGPHYKSISNFDMSAFYKVFQYKKFRKAAYGYFGHMWELYAFWAFIPLIISSYNVQHDNLLNVSLWSFLVIAAGTISCAVSGFISLKYGPKKVAVFALSLSGICCLLSPLIFQVENTFIFALFILIWGMSVIADSPMLSTLVAKNAPSDFKGTALTIVNCLGFSITILSIQLLTYISNFSNHNFIYLILALGPMFGLYKLKK